MDETTKKLDEILMDIVHDKKADHSYYVQTRVTTEPSSLRIHDSPLRLHTDHRRLETDFSKNDGYMPLNTQRTPRRKEFFWVESKESDHY